jgi:hypothetical protein
MEDLWMKTSLIDVLASIEPQLASARTIFNAMRGLMAM